MQFERSLHQRCRTRMRTTALQKPACRSAMAALLAEDVQANKLSGQVLNALSGRLRDSITVCHVGQSRQRQPAAASARMCLMRRSMNMAALSCARGYQALPDRRNEPVRSYLRSAQGRAWRMRCENETDGNRADGGDRPMDTHRVKPSMPRFFALVAGAAPFVS